MWEQVGGLVVTFVSGFGVGCLLMWIMLAGRANPGKEAQAKLEYDLKHRLGMDGKPINTLNDYERHLYALSLKRAGKSRADIEAALLVFLEDIPQRKRAKYIKMVMESTIVGFGEILLPSYQEVKLSGTSNSSS